MILVTVLMISVQTQLADYPYVPVPFAQVQIQDEFWAPRIETNRTVTIPYDAWAHRGPGEMAVWLARNREALDRVEQADFEPEQ